MTILAIVAAVLVGLLVNEMSEVSPWVARKIVGWSAHLRYSDGSGRAAIRSEELAALINERPGKLLKLLTASGFAAASIAYRLRQRLTGESNPEPGLSLDGFRRLIPSEQEASRLVARYLFPTERYRGEWRRHVILPAKEVGYGLGAGLLVWYVGEVRLQLHGFGLPEYELVLAPSLFVIGLVVVAWSLWRVARWWFNRFALTNKRLMVVKGVFNRRVVMAPLRAAELSYRQLVPGRLLNYGTFTLRSVGLFHPLRRTTHLPNPNELYLRAIEEVYEPAAVDARMTDASRIFMVEEEVYERVARVLAAAMGTTVWPLIRDTFTEVMVSRRLGVAGQLDSEAHRIAEAGAAEQDAVRGEVAAAWRHRLACLSDRDLAWELSETGEKVLRCMPESAQSWIDASRTTSTDAARRDGCGDPSLAEELELAFDVELEKPT